MKEIAQALLKAQTEMSNPIKGSQNPFLKNKYADLNAVREAVIPTLNKHGITVLQPMQTVDGKNYVKTVLLHESGETIESLTEIIYSKQNDAQAQGSGITYARRYGLQSLVCVGADDDDGNNASKPQKDAKKEYRNEVKAPVQSEIDKDLKIAIDDLENANDVDSVKFIWDTYGKLQSNSYFVKAVKLKKQSFADGTK